MSGFVSMPIVSHSRSSGRPTAAAWQVAVAPGWIFLYRIAESVSWAAIALVAQLVEHLICNQGVAGSNPAGGTILIARFTCSLDEHHLKHCFSSNSAAAMHLILIIKEETAMKIAHIILTAAISAGAAFASIPSANAMPANRPAVSAQGDVVQIHDSWRRDRWGDDRDWRGDRDWRDDRDWRPSEWRPSEWRYERRHWRPWRAEGWRERREWRYDDRDMPRFYHG